MGSSGEVIRILLDERLKKIDIREIEFFGTLAARVIRDRRTYLGIDRLYSLWQLIETLPKDSRAIVEVGAYRGGSARFIAEALRMQGREMPFYVCDTFQGHTAVDEEVDGLHQPGQQFHAARTSQGRQS